MPVMNCFINFLTSLSAASTSGDFTGSGGGTSSFFAPFFAGAAGYSIVASFEGATQSSGGGSGPLNCTLSGKSIFICEFAGQFCAYLLMYNRSL